MKLRTLLLAAPLLLSSAKAAPPAVASPTAPVVPAAVVGGNTAFAVDLYARLRTKPGNVFFSPASISTALAMTWAGARGDTAAQIAKTMHFTLPAAQHHDGYGALLRRLASSGPNAPQLAIANRLWVQKGFPLEAAFVKTTTDAYDAGSELVDFKTHPEGARAIINAWVEKKTAQKIKDLFPEGSILDTQRLVLTNAIWFKGEWQTAFAKQATHDAPFFATPASSKKVPTMHATLHARYAETDVAQVVALPYKSADASRAVSMVIVLPKAKDGLAKVEAALTPASLEAFGKTAPFERVAVALPRFSTTQSLDLGDHLKALGMPLAFAPFDADFSGIAKKVPLYLSKVLHKAFVEVNEQGTEAAAATGVGVAEASAVPAPPKPFTADRPFLFFVRDDATGTVLFLGRVSDPT